MWKSSGKLPGLFKPALIVTYVTVALALAVAPCAYADTIPTLTATSASYSGMSFAFDGFSASGPSFNFDGGTVGPISIPFFGSGQPIGVVSIGFPEGFAQPPYYIPTGQIAVGSTTYDAVFSGSGNVSTLPNTVIWPSSPDPSVSVPAVMHGEFSACISSTLPVCDMSFPIPFAKISIDLRGELVFSPESSGVLMSATFTSTPVPEPAAIKLILLCCCIAVGTLPIRTRISSPVR